MADGSGAPGNGDANNSRISRYAKVDLSGITVRKAVTEADFELVGRLRQAGFSRVVTRENVAWVDESDQRPGIFSLLAYGHEGEPLATMRIQDGRISELELARLIPIASLLKESDRPAAQFGRLSVVKGSRSDDAMFGIFKAAWLWCLHERIQSMVIASPFWARHIHRFMHFTDLGPEGNFRHDFANGVEHITMKLSVTRAEEIWRNSQNPLCEQMIDITHKSLIFGN